MTTAKPRTPPGLAAAGARVWRDIVEVYTLRPDELLLLDKVCRTTDDLSRLERAIAGADLVTVGSTGQPRAHPLLAEIRGMRALLVTLLRQLDLPDAVVDPVASALRAEERSSKARRAAGVRWNHDARRIG